MAPELGDDETPWDRLVDEQRTQVPTCSEPRPSIDPEWTTTRRPDLRPPEPPDSRSGRRRSARRRNACAQPVERSSRQRLRVRRRPGSSRSTEVRREPTDSISCSGEGDALRAPGQQEREGRPRPHNPDDKHRHPGEHQHQDLEHPEPIAFHAPVSRATGRKPRTRSPVTARASSIARRVAERGTIE